MLTVDPSQRATLDQISQHAWLRAHGYATALPAGAATGEPTPAQPQQPAAHAEQPAVRRVPSSFSFAVGAPGAAAAAAHQATPPTPKLASLQQQQPAGAAAQCCLLPQQPADALHLLISSSTNQPNQPPTPLLAVRPPGAPSIPPKVPVLVEAQPGAKPLPAPAGSAAAQQQQQQQQQPAAKKARFDLGSWCTFLWPRAPLATCSDAE